MARKSAVKTAAASASPRTPGTRDVVETAIELSKEPGTWESKIKKMAGRFSRWTPKTSTRSPSTATEVESSAE